MRAQGVPPPHVRRRRLALAAAAAVGSVLIAFVLLSDRPGAPEGATITTVALPTDPIAAAEAFLAAWGRADWAEVGTLANPDAANVLAEWWRDLQVESARLSVDAVDRREDGATVAFTVVAELRDAGVFEYPSVLELVLAGDAWRVAWMPGTVHPSLAAGGHLELRRVPTPRAPILAEDGSPLVGDVADVVVGVIPGRVESPDELRAALAAAVGVDGSDVDALLGRSDLRADWFYPLATIPGPAYPTVKPALYPVPGVAFRVAARRGPAEPGFAAHLLGRTGEVTAELLAELGGDYASGDVVGTSGLERRFERSLAGRAGAEVVRIDTHGEIAEVLASYPGRPGEPLRTTLSVSLQRAAEAVLGEAGLPGAVVVLDAATGEVRAAASRPGEEFNRAFSGLYPPGSTFKIVVAAALLEAGLTPQTQVPCPPVVRVGGTEFRNAVELPATMTLERAFAMSCNTAFIAAARTHLAPADLASMAQRFGFGVDYDVGLPAAGGSYPEPATEAEAAAAVIGQGRVLASPLHMAAVVAAAATGSWHAPTLIDGEPREAPAGALPAEDLRQMMAAVVRSGTGRQAAVPGHEVMGKTGTAQVGAGDEASTVAWFVGAADGLAVAVAVEGGGSGGGAAAPLVASMLARLDAGVATAERCVPAGSDWAMFQGSPSRSGCSAAPVIREPRVRWSREIGIQAWLNGPIVVGDTVVVGTGGELRTIPDGADGVVALDLATGEERWRFVAGNDVNGVAAAGGRVFATGDEGAVWALDLATGGVVWRFDDEWPVFTNPLPLGEIVVVGDALGTVYALDVDDGAVRWSHPLGTPIRGGAASDGELVFVAAEGGAAAAFTMDGFELWSTEIGEPGPGLRVLAVPTVVGGRVVVSVVSDEGPGLVALDRYVGVPLWTSGGAGAVRTSGAAVDAGLVVATSPNTGVTAVEPVAGAELWARGDWAVCDTQVSSPVVAGDVAYLGRLDGSVYAVDVASGETRWRHSLAVPGFSVLTPDCEPRDALGTAAPIQATPAVAPDGSVVVGTMAGYLYVVEDATGD